MQNTTPSVISRHTLRTTRIISDGKEPSLAFFLGTLRTHTFYEFIYMSRVATNLQWLKHDGSYYHDMKGFIMASLKDWKFIDVKLDKSQKGDVQKFGDQYDKDYLGIIDDISELGYKVSVSYVDKQNSYVVSVSGSERSGYNKGCTLTSWAAELGEAVQIAGYKVLDYMRNKDWVEFESDAETWG